MWSHQSQIEHQPTISQKYDNVTWSLLKPRTSHLILGLNVNNMSLMTCKGQHCCSELSKNCLLKTLFKRSIRPIKFVEHSDIQLKHRNLNPRLEMTASLYSNKLYIHSSLSTLLHLIPSMKRRIKCNNDDIIR